MIPLKRAEIVEKLQTDILRLQGFKQPTGGHSAVELGMILDAFPNSCFPVGAIHEFLSERPEETASTTGFVGGLLSSLMNNGGASVWIGSSCSLFPPGLRHFGVQPDRVIFLHPVKEKDILWTMEEALKCPALSAVVAEVPDLSFTASRRLQLAVERSKVTGFVLRTNVRKVQATACVCRWRITPLPGMVADDLPGLGIPQWRVALLRVRNGRPGVWDVRWMNNSFYPVLGRIEKTKPGSPSPVPETSFEKEVQVSVSYISSPESVPGSGKHLKAG